MILLIGGTHDSRKLCHYLNEVNQAYFMTVATALGQATYQNDAKEILMARLDTEAMAKLCHQRGVSLILDASHPHATEVSLNAMAAAKMAKVPYVRWLRDSIDYDAEVVTVVESFEAAFEVLKETEGNILITGSKELAKAVRELPKHRLVARIVPNSDSIAACEAVGLDAAQIIGLKGPFTEAMNQVLFEAFQIEHIVFKESGSGSGFLEKIQAAKQMGVNPIVVAQPKLNYPIAINTFEALASYLG